MTADRAANRRTHSRAVVCGTPACPAAVRTPRPPSSTATRTAPTAVATSSRRSRQKSGSTPWLTRHGVHLARGTHIRAHRPAVRTHRQYPDQNDIGDPQAGQFGRGSRICRPLLRYSSTEYGQVSTTAKVATPPRAPPGQRELKREGPLGVSGPHLTAPKVGKSPGHTGRSRRTNRGPAAPDARPGIQGRRPEAAGRSVNRQPRPEARRPAATRPGSKAPSPSAHADNSDGRAASTTPSTRQIRRSTR